MVNMLLLCVILCFVINDVTSQRSYKTEIDLITERLKHEEWEENERDCLEDVMFVLDNVNNHTTWAVWIWNSMNRPSGIFYGSNYNLGNYDQCLQTPIVNNKRDIKTQYCLAEVKIVDEKKEDSAMTKVMANLPWNLDIMEYFERRHIVGKTDEILAGKTKLRRKLNTLIWGTCFPFSCKPASVGKLVNAIYNTNPITSIEPEITVDHCQVSGENNEFDGTFYAFITLIVSLITISLVSTLCLDSKTTDSTISKIANSFNLKRNWSSLTHPGNEIPVISFTKTALVITTTCIHIFVFSFQGAVTNALELDSFTSGKTDSDIANLIPHIDIAIIDNFFFISGLLFMTGILQKNENLLKLLIQRYLRFFGNLAMLIFFTTSVMKHTANGPLWYKLIGTEETVCSKNWLICLLMLNNYINSDSICQMITWYVACDYQLAVIGTIFVYLWRWEQRIGRIVIILASLLFLVAPGIAIYRTSLPGLLGYDIEAMIGVRKNLVYLETYSKSHYRVTTYLMGMVMGYILTEYKPTKYRGIISKKWSYIGLLIGSVLGLRVLVTAPAWCLGEYNAWNSAVYVTLSRPLWAVATMTCITVNEYGDLATFRHVMSWSGFVFISRLAYGIYIVNSILIQRWIFSQKSPITHDAFNMLVHASGVFLVSLLIAILLWLFIEAPLRNVTNLILSPKKHFPVKKN